jgi:hypothetical protein
MRGEIKRDAGRVVDQPTKPISDTTASTVILFSNLFVPRSYEQLTTALRYHTQFSSLGPTNPFFCGCKPSQQVQQGP